ncbi:unnamed protein product [Effrenium voratum]|nr:unnamed protein product [Effrenium voratum]
MGNQLERPEFGERSTKEVSEAPVRKKAQGSPSEQSTAPTAGEDAAQEAHELPGETRAALRGGPRFAGRGE